MSWAKFDEKTCEVSCSWPTFNMDGSLRPDDVWDSISGRSLRFVPAAQRMRIIEHEIPMVAARAFIEAKRAVVARERFMKIHQSLQRILAARRRFWSRSEAL